MIELNMVLPLWFAYIAIGIGIVFIIFQIAEIIQNWMLIRLEKKQQALNEYVIGRTEVTHTYDYDGTTQNED